MTALDHASESSNRPLHNGRHPHMDSLASKRNPPWPPILSGKVRKLSHNFPQGRRGGFQVDSPVKKPVASEMPRSAPPYTDCAREEPCRGASAFTEPLPCLINRSDQDPLRKSSTNSDTGVMPVTKRWSRARVHAT